MDTLFPPALLRFPSEKRRGGPATAANASVIVDLPALFCPTTIVSPLPTSPLGTALIGGESSEA